MIGSAAFAAVLINYDLMARGRLGDAHSKALGVRISRGRGCALKVTGDQVPVSPLARRKYRGL